MALKIVEVCFFQNVYNFWKKQLLTNFPTFYYSKELDFHDYHYLNLWTSSYDPLQQAS